MIRDIFYYFRGSYKVTVEESFKRDAVNIMYVHQIHYYKPRLIEDGSFAFRIFSNDYDAIKTLFEDSGIHYEISDIMGIPRTIRFLKRRPGIACGILIFFSIIWLSSRVIWNFSVTGNDSVPESDILSLLDDLGCGYGDFIPTIDFDSLHAKFLSESDNIAWISVNMKGTHANVEVREVINGNRDVRDEGTYANIIASEDAQIMSLRITEGTAQVVPGDVVKKGDILISGVIPVKEDKIRYEYAEGVVEAYVKRVIEVEIPVDGRKKAYTGNSKSEKSIKIFKNSLNLFRKSGIEYSTYDKIEKNNQVMLFGMIPLPVWMNETIYKEYGYIGGALSEEEAVATGMTELRDRMDEIMESSELISNKMTSEMTDSTYRIRCDMICAADIAQIKEFKVSDLTPGTVLENES